MRTLHLCCGRGGSLWTGAILGWQSRWAVDADPWRIECLQREAASGWWPALDAFAAELPDTGWHARINEEVDLLAAGFSCRDISAAGRGAGLGGNSTGPTYRGCLDAIDAFRPAWVLFENSPRIRGNGLDTVLADLRDREYRARDGIIAAADVGAPHQRDRWYCLAHRADIACGGFKDHRLQRKQWTQDSATMRRCRTVDANAMRDGLQIAVQRGGISETARDEIEALAGHCEAYHWNPIEPGLLRVVDGLADRRKRIGALGDAWVPLQASAAWCLLGGPIGCIAT